MRRAAKIDDNQQRVVNALRCTGCSVAVLAAVGKGVPDILAAKAGRTVLLEVKDGAKPPSARRLTPDQVAFHAAWRGELYVVTSEAEALRVMAARPPLNVVGEAT